MSKRTNKRQRNLRYAIAISACFSLPTAMLAACTETSRGLGEACLKGEDCTSGVCVAQLCAASPPLLQGTPVTTNDAAVDATVPADASDASQATDAPIDAPVVDASDSDGD
ncbi:MAG: hypothetical protein ABI183_21810 [Polyangiaceae bacterium]